MKKFIIKVSVGFAIFIIFVLIINTLYVNTEYYANLNEMGKFHNIPDHIDIVNFGASHSQNAFNWQGYKFNGVNMALGAQTIVYDAALFDSYYEHLDKDSTVIMELMFKSLYEAEPSEYPYGTNITRYYQVLSKRYIKHWNILDEINYQLIPILGNREKGFDSVFNEYLFKDKQTQQVENKLMIDNDNPTQVLTGWVKEDMQNEGKRRAQVFMDLSGNQELNEQYNSLIHVIEKCQEKGIQIILVTAPTLPCFYENFSDQFMNKFYEDINTICKKYNVDYYDYTGDERLLTNYQWYRDTDHLNESGSELFTSIFLTDHLDRFYFIK